MGAYTSDLEVSPTSVGAHEMIILHLCHALSTEVECSSLQISMLKAKRAQSR